MGYSTVETSVTNALARSAQLGDRVTEASKEEYFTDYDWMNSIKSAELGDNNKVYFNLINGDFVVVE